MQKSYLSKNFKGPVFEIKRYLHCGGYDYEECLDVIMDAPLSSLFFTKRMKMLSRPDNFMLYGKLGVAFSPNSEWLYPNMVSRLQLMRARPNFYRISDNTNASLRIVDCSLYTRRIALTDDYRGKRMYMLAYTPVEYNNSQTLAKTFIIPATQNQFSKKNFLNIAQVCRTAIKGIQNLHKVDQTLKIYSGISNSISDNLELSNDINK